MSRNPFLDPPAAFGSKPSQNADTSRLADDIFVSHWDPSLATTGTDKIKRIEMAAASGRPVLPATMFSRR